jgi:ribosome-associated heat shock protein Hsp15
LVYGAGLRIDKYLWFVRLAPSRAAARDLCESRRLRIDGRVVDRASAQVRAGNVLSWPRGDAIIAIRVESLPERRGPYPQACQCYTDLSPAGQASPGAAADARNALLPDGLALA